MKKIISVIAALAMLGAFVGCGPIDMSFKEHTETISKTNNTSVYPITSCTQNIGKDVIEVHFNPDATNPDYSTITLTSKQEGSAAMILESEAYCKKAEVVMSVLGTGSITGTYNLKEYQYGRSTANANEYLWKDVSGTTNPLGLANGLYRATTNEENDIENQGSLSYIYVNGKIIYYIYYKLRDYESTVYSYDFKVTFVRTIMNGTSGNITLTYDTEGSVSVVSSSAYKYFAEEKYSASNEAKYGIVDGSDPMWKGTNWTKNGNNLTNGSVVYTPYNSSLPMNYAMK